MRFARGLAKGMIGISSISAAGGGYGYVMAGEKTECASTEAVADRVFCGLGRGSSQEVLDQIQHYIQVVEDFFLSFTDNPETVPAAVSAQEFGLDTHSSWALRVPDGMPELAAHLTDEQIMTMATISFEDIKR